MRYITVAIHTYEKAIALRSLLESEGISVELNNVNLEVPGFSSGVRVRIPEHDLPLALRIIENKELFAQPAGEQPVEHTYLVPVDFSEKSFKAAEVAAHLAAQKGARLKFLYSYIDPYVDGNVQLTDTLSYEIGERGAREALGANAESLMRNFAERGARTGADMVYMEGYLLDLTTRLPKACPKMLLPTMPVPSCRR